MTHLSNPVPQHRSRHSPRKEDDMSIEQLKQQLTAPPSAEELARRKDVFARIVAHRREASIAPLTTADLVHQAREEEERSYGGDH
jgi:hypothetical protein